MQLADSAPAETDSQDRQGLELTRVIGRYSGAADGPLFLCIAGLHGNEPAGVHALRSVFRELSRRQPAFHGDFVALAGNLSALAEGCRFVDEDLNRVWQSERVRAIRESMAGPVIDSPLSHEPDGQEPEPGEAAMELARSDSAELREQSELLAAMDRETAAARGPVFVLDLHTTSSESKPFVTLGDTLPSRALAEEFPIPLILGLEEQLDGALLEHLDLHGLVGVGIEGGSHTSPGSVVAHEAILWIALATIGNLVPREVPDLPACMRHLSDATRELPRIMEVRYRHEVQDGDGFKMLPGFDNFQKIRAGEIVARDALGPITAPEGGRMFLPLYQEWGDDGYFVVREVKPFWLKVSAALRGMHLYRAAPLMPFVRKHPDREDALIVHPFAARDSVIGLLHLLGFRRRVENGTTLMIRRKDDSPVATPIEED